MGATILQYAYISWSLIPQTLWLGVTFHFASLVVVLATLLVVAWIHNHYKYI